jgi:hypothetical protein
MFAKKSLAICLFVGLAMLAAPSASLAIEPGETVFAYWPADSVYFLGTVVEKSAEGYLVVFDDGDQITAKDDRIFKNDLKVGSAVMARWNDGKFYSGKIAKVVGRAYYIHYDDGDKGWAPFSWIAIKK